MNPLILWAIKLTGILLNARQSGLTTQLLADLDALRATLTPLLPEKADGSAWTDADLAALASEHYAITSGLTARHGADGTGEP